MIKNIIFDMGQVLIYFDPDTFISRIGIADKEDRKILIREVYKSLEWSRMDRGDLTDEQACELMQKRVPEHLKEAVRLLTVDWCRPLLPVPGMEKLIKTLKDNGYKIYLLSNASRQQKDYWEQIPGSEYFDGRVVSSEVGFVKPETQIYEILCDRYDLSPSECVFIDDSTPNAEGAFHYGINAIVFHDDMEELREKLRSFGVRLEA